MNYETDIISIVSKLQVNHELKTAQSINEIVINPWLVACTWKLLNFKRMISKIRVYIEDSTRWREDMNFIFDERAQRVSKILFLPRENKIYIFKPPCNIMFLLLYRQNDINKIIEGNYQNYVIDKLTCEIMENKPLGSRM